jgi:hypothetical protein
VRVGRTRSGHRHGRSRRGCTWPVDRVASATDRL